MAHSVAEDRPTAASMRNLVLTPNLIRRLRKAADNRNVNMSAVARWALQDWLDANEPEPAEPFDETIERRCTEWVLAEMKAGRSPTVQEQYEHRMVLYKEAGL